MDGPLPQQPSKGGPPMPWLVLRAMIATEWGIPAFEVPHKSDWQHELCDEVGRWIEAAILKQKYPAG